MEKTKYPCKKCENKKCYKSGGRGKDCEKWRSWFSAKWREIRMFFGVECVDSTRKEKE